MRQQFEKYLTKLPMYVVTLSLLSLLIVVAAFMPISGMVSFTPLALIATTLVFSGVSISASYVLGRLYAAPSHLQSALVTALILTLLFTPTLDLSRLAVYALVGAIAASSKYVVAYKRRHLFNPAAFGAFVIGLSGLAHASWWVGSPVFMPFVAVAGFLLLYKTRQLLLGAVYLAVSIAVLAVTGTTPMVALLSWPLLFLAGFMLSEPLTLPAGRPQKLAVATLVAVVTSLPFSIGIFGSSPAFALLAGNLLAFILAFRERSGLQLTLKGLHDLTPNTKEIVLSSPVPLHFIPGQYVELTLLHAHPDLRGFRRSFSITSAPGERELRLGVKFYESGSSFKRALVKLRKGMIVQATGITGDFVLPSNPNQKLLLIAGGIGITPFISYLRSGMLEGRDAILLYYVRTPAEAAYKDELTKAPVTIYYFAASDEQGEFKRNRRLDSYTLNTLVPDLHERHAYVSGPPAMVAGAKRLLRGRAKRTHTDYFSGY